MSRHQNFTFSEFLELMVLLFLGGRLLTMILHCRCEEEEQICGMKGRREEEERKRMQRLSFRKSKERGKERMKGSGVSFFFNKWVSLRYRYGYRCLGDPKSCTIHLQKESTYIGWCYMSCTIEKILQHCHNISQHTKSIPFTNANVPRILSLQLERKHRGAMFFHRNMPWLGKDFATPTRGWVNLGRAENGWKGHWNDPGEGGKPNNKPSPVTSHLGGRFRSSCY